MENKTGSLDKERYFKNTSVANKLRLSLTKIDDHYYLSKVKRSPRPYSILKKTKDMSEIEDLLEELEEPREGSFKEVNGDLIKMAKNGDFDAIAHGCNCFATMGAGIAKLIKKNFPGAFKADKDYEADEYQRFSGFTYSVQSNWLGDLFVFNLYTQFMPGPSMDIEALTLSLRKMAMFLRDEEPHITKIGLPLIGCGIGGGDWDHVKEIIKQELNEFDVTIVHYKS